MCVGALFGWPNIQDVDVLRCHVPWLHEASEYSLPSGLGHDGYRSISYMCVFGNVRSRSKEGDGQRDATTHQGNFFGVPRLEL
jgi:hypothetical protein